MKERPFSTAECEALFGPECIERVNRAAAEAPRFTPEQILRGRAIFATFRIPKAPPADPAE